MSTEETEETPQVIADIVCLATGVMIPAGVIATWTPHEREDAAEWASAEHLHASDNQGVKRVPQPEMVARAVAITQNPAMAQLAVEGWARAKDVFEHGDFDGWDNAADILVKAGTDAITGLLVLLGQGSQPERPTWQGQALEVLGEHPEGVRAIDLFALLGRAVPSQHALEEWLAAGQSMGLLIQVAHDVWAVRDPAGGTVRRQRP